MGKQNKLEVLSKKRSILVPKYVLELTVKITIDSKRARITARYTCLSLQNDQDLSELFESVTIYESGGVVYIKSYVRMEVYLISKVTYLQ